MSEIYSCKLQLFLLNRKQPQPIGTERARKILNPAVSDWMLNSERNMAGLRWPTTTNTMDRYTAIQRNQMYLDETHIMDSFQVSNRQLFLSYLHVNVRCYYLIVCCIYIVNISFQHGMAVENVHGFANGAAIPPYFLQQQIANDFVPPMKVDLPWEPSRSMADLQDKPHVRNFL